MMHVPGTTLGSESTRFARFRFGSILVQDYTHTKIPAFVPQALPSRTAVDILLRIIDELIRIELLSHTALTLLSGRVAVGLGQRTDKVYPLLRQST